MVPNSIKNRDRIRRWTMPCAWSHFEYKIVNRPMVAVVTFERATAPVSVMLSFAYHWKGNWTSFPVIPELLGVNILQHIVIWVWSRFFKKKMVIFLFFPSCYISLESSCYQLSKGAKNSRVACSQPEPVAARGGERFSLSSPKRVRCRERLKFRVFQVRVKNTLNNSWSNKQHTIQEQIFIFISMQFILSQVACKPS